MPSKLLEEVLVRSTSSDYWAAYIVGENIKTDGLKQQTQTDVITH